MPEAPTRAFADERRAAILTMLETQASVQVADLAETFGVSAVTIRGDLDALERAGKLRRTHGGAVSLHKRLTVSVQDQRVNVHAEAKQAAARAALELVEDGDSLLIDSGTTALEFVRTLGARQGITVITADITIANYVDEALPGVDVIILGGTLRKSHRYLYGQLTLAALEMLHPDKAFVCPISLVPGRGLMTNNERMAAVKAACMRAARTTIGLMDSSKVGASGLIRFAGLEELDALVMDSDPEGGAAAAIAALPEGAPRPRLVLAG